MKKISRREFLKEAAGLGAGIGAVIGAGVIFPGGCKAKSDNNTVPNKEHDDKQLDQAITGNPDISVVRGLDPAEMTRRAIDAIGGIARFVKKGNDVIIKPNICTDYYSFEYAATTNPVVVATIVNMCLQAGAKRVRVMDNVMRGTANPQKGYKVCGIQDAVEKAGGIMEIMNPVKFRDTPIPNGKEIKSWLVYQEILKADVVINVPIPKDHPATEITVGLKNLMGVAGKPGKFHDNNLSQRITDLATIVRPALTVVDAIRILTNNGPTGGSLSDVKMTNTIIATHDMVAADYYATTLFSLSGNDIVHMKAAAEMGLGESDLSKLLIKEIVI